MLDTAGKRLLKPPTQKSTEEAGELSIRHGFRPKQSNLVIEGVKTAESGIHYTRNIVLLALDARNAFNSAS